jgi:predicted nucleotidyltransferase component of viral defense system
MNNSNAMSLKARIKNLAKEKYIPAQVALQNYFFECFLNRLTQSEYRDNFILKGGLLIAAMVGLDTRTTMDMDTTLRSFPLDEEHIRTALSKIVSIPTDDDIRFQISRVNMIRDDDEYGGYRVSLNAMYKNINSPLSIDITTGDVITPKPIKRKIKSFFDESKYYELWSYNTETILAEKIETILRRGALNTRPRDFYDVYIIAKTQKFDKNVFHQALSATSIHRGSAELIHNVDEILAHIEKNAILKQHWEKYRREYLYAKDIDFADTIKVIKELLSEE